jgi:hypothetical protein
MAVCLLSCVALNPHLSTADFFFWQKSAQLGWQPLL